MKQYEYKIITIVLENKVLYEEKITAELNRQGKEGWIVCSTHALPVQEDEKLLRVLLVREVTKRGRKIPLKEAEEDLILTKTVPESLPNAN